MSQPDNCNKMELGHVSDLPLQNAIQQIRFRHFLTFETQEHHDAYIKFRMDESSLPLQISGCLVGVVTNIAMLLQMGSITALSFVFVVTRCAAMLSLVLYTLHLCQYKNFLLQDCNLIRNQNPAQLSNIGLILLMFSGCIRLLYVVLPLCSQKKVDLPMEEVMLLMFQLLLMKLFYKAAEWWALVTIGLLCAVSLTLNMIFFRYPETTVFAVLAFGIVGTFALYEDEKSNVNWFISFSTIEKATRSSIESEMKKQDALQMSQELRSFIGNIAHDLKTPLQALVTEINMLDVVEDKSLMKDSISSLNGTCSFMSMMINRSLDFVKSESGVPLIASVATIEIAKSLKWVADTVSRISKHIPINISVIPRNVCPYIISDKQWLEENLLCLLSNAVKFTTSGLIDIRISLVSQDFITAMKDNDATILQASECSEDVFGNNDKHVLLFEVEDSGIGLTKQQRKILFQPFRQAQRKCGGTGLGLYALAKRVQAIGGDYGVRGKKGGGTGSLFWFSLPYDPDEETARSVLQTDMELKKLDRQLISGQKVRKSHIMEESLAPKVLLVEDTPLIQKTTSRALRNQGYKVTSALNGVECLNALDAEESFDFILLDIQMPVMVCH